MTDSAVTHIGIQTMILTTKLAAPVLLTALAVGVLIGLVQSATQLQESTIAFVPKFAAIGIVLIITGNWMLSEAITFTLGYSNDAFGSDETGIYYGVSGSYGLPWYELSLNGSFGYYDLDDVLGDSYNDYSIGLSKEFGPVEGALTYIDTDNNGEDIFGENARSRVVLSLTLGL